MIFSKLKKFFKPCLCVSVVKSSWIKVDSDGPMLVGSLVKLSKFVKTVVIDKGQPYSPGFAFFEFPLEPHLGGFVQGPGRLRFPFQMEGGVTPQEGSDKIQGGRVNFGT